MNNSTTSLDDIPDNPLVALLAERERRRRVRFNSPKEPISWCPHQPTERQSLFLDLTVLEAFLGGAAGGGKSEALGMAALQYVDVPGYSALLLMKSLKDLAKPKALMNRVGDWLRGTGAQWSSEKKRWTFPSGAMLDFGFIDNDADKYNFRTAEYQFIGFDELTRFAKSTYTYMFSRLRRLLGVDIPIRMRSASNPAQPGEPGMMWVEDRFIPDNFTPEMADEPRVIIKEGATDEGEKVIRYFVPARIEHNPHLDLEEYEMSLSELDPVTKAQLRRGDWKIRAAGDIYWMFDARYVFVPWSRWKAVFKVACIPSHWLLSVSQDQGTSDGHILATGWFATAAKNSPIPDLVAMYRAYMCTKRAASEVGDAMQVLMGMRDEPKEQVNIDEGVEPDGLGGIGERGRMVHWLSSHEAESERLEYLKMKMPFRNWTAGPNNGIAQMRNRLTIIDKDKPNPFHPELMGRTRFVCIVPDSEWPLRSNKSVWARIEAEFQAYHYAKLKTGEENKKVAPHALFNDFMDCIREAALDAFPPVKGLTDDEQLEAAIPEAVRKTTIEKLPTEERGAAWAERLMHMAEEGLDKRGRKRDDDDWERIANQ